MPPSIAGPEVPSHPGNQPASANAVVPFRRATTRRTAISSTTTGTVSASTQNFQVVIEGTGFMTGVVLRVDVTTAGNSANTAYAADAPWNALESVVLSDPTGEVLNLSGYELFLLNKWGRWYGHGTTTASSTDTNIYRALTSTGATGGSFTFFIRVPTAVNPRNFLGLLGNQDRALKYQLRTDFAASASIYSTAPTAFGAITIDRFYESVTVPGRTNADGIPQEIMPRKFGVQHFATRIISESAPVGGSTVNHFLRRLNNTIRVIILKFQSNGSRATAETNLPTRIRFLLGDQTILSETGAYRRFLMHERYGYDADAGVLVYDWIEDMRFEAGSEFGLDYLWTGGVVNAQLEVTYPAGFGSTNNELVILTSDLLVPDTINLYAPDGV